MDKDTIQQIVDQSTVITNAHISFQNAVKKIRKEDGQITDICSAHQELKQAVDSFELPRTSRSSQKTQQSTNPEQSSKRKSTEPGPSTSTDHLVPPKKKAKADCRLSKIFIFNKTKIKEYFSARPKKVNQR